MHGELMLGLATKCHKLRSTQLSERGGDGTETKGSLEELQSGRCIHNHRVRPSQMLTLTSSPSIWHGGVGVAGRSLETVYSDYTRNEAIIEQAAQEGSREKCLYLLQSLKRFQPSLSLNPRLLGHT